MSPASRYIAVSTLALVGLLHPASGDSDPPQPGWGLPRPWLLRLAEQADAYLERSYRFTCVETSRRVRYREPRPIVRERRYRYVPGGNHEGNPVPEFRLQIAPRGRVSKPIQAETVPFPSADDWTQLFSTRNQPFFMYRDLGVRLEGFDLVREIEFRGWLRFTDGRDIRQWEGIALVEASGFRLVGVRARPRNQQARVAYLFDKWSRSLKIRVGLFAGPWFFPIVTFRTARRPLAYHCEVRFDHWRPEIRLPTLLRYETRRAVSRERTERRLVSTRRYDECHGGSEGD